VRDSLPFSQSQIGDIQSDVPGLTFKWIAPPSSPYVASYSAQRDLGYNTLQISYNGLSLSSTHGMTLTGTTSIQLPPPVFELDFVRSSSSFLPPIDHFLTGFQARVDGSVTLTSTYGGNLTANKTWFDKDVGPPQLYGWLLFQPHLKIESSVAGTSSGGVNHTQSVGLAANSFIAYSRGGGWTSGKQFTATMTASESKVDAAYGIVIKPISITLSYNLYYVVGPYGELNANVTATGTHTVQSSVEGIDALVTAAAGGDVGLSASTPSALSSLFEASWTPINVSFDMANKVIFHKFFPFTGSASITVGDNGPAPDDVFAVSVDGTLLGQTDKGGTGGFRLTHLVPGAHTLTIKCLDDGANGADVCTLGISLSDGLTFSDRSVQLSDQLQLNQVKNYSIVVPSAPTVPVTAMNTQLLPKSKVLIERPTSSTGSRGKFDH
jgi:hypothetical protein